MTYVDAWYFWRKELEIDLSGFKKEEVRAELKDGYLTVSAETNTKKDEKAEDRKYIRRERYSGSCSRRQSVQSKTWMRMKRIKRPVSISAVNVIINTGILY